MPGFFYGVGNVRTQGHCLQCTVARVENNPAGDRRFFKVHLTRCTAATGRLSSRRYGSQEARVTAQTQFHQLMIFVMIAIFAGMAVNFTYIYFLNQFFKELQQTDPEAWRAIGSPDAGEMTGNQGSLKQYYAFVGTLRAKARQPHGYPAAKKAWRWLCIAAASTGSIACGALLAILTMS